MFLFSLLFGKWIISIVHIKKSYSCTGDKSTDDGTASIPGVVMFIMLVSYFWGLEVLKNVVATTVTGVPSYIHTYIPYHTCISRTYSNFIQSLFIHTVHIVVINR